MVTRDKRNIGKIVKVVNGGAYTNKIGKVVGFRGDYDKNIPYVEVFIYDLHSKKGGVYPFAGNLLVQQ